jgi:hypothetical protein
MITTSNLHRPVPAGKAPEARTGGPSFSQAGVKTVPVAAGAPKTGGPSFSPQGGVKAAPSPTATPGQPKTGGPSFAQPGVKAAPSPTASPVANAGQPQTGGPSFAKPLTGTPSSPRTGGGLKSGPPTKAIDPVILGGGGKGVRTPAPQHVPNPAPPVNSLNHPQADTAFSGGVAFSSGSHHSSSSVVVNVGFGFGFGSWWAPGCPTFSGCFTSCNPCWWTGPNVWHSPYHVWPASAYWGSPWCGSCSFFSFPCGPCPSWCWRPVWWWNSFPCGNFVHVGFCGSGVSVGASFSFCGTPAFSTCSLVPSCATPIVADGTYRYGWYTPGVESVVNEWPSASVATQAQAGVAALEVTTDRQLADTYMRLGDLANAVRVYSDHVGAHPEDAEAHRSLGVALLATDRPEEGASQIEAAYRTDPTLAQRPLPTDLLAAQSTMRQVTDNATRLATSNPSPSSWLAVAVLMQAQGQVGPARSALDKARLAGLDDNVVQSMSDALPTSGN